MKKDLFKVGLFSLMAFVAIGMKAQEQLPAFPGAEGHGRYTTGGRGGVVYHVTNLNDSGEGSFRYAAERAGVRTIVFDVSGTIHLESDLTIKSNVTIAGQTSPGGICIADRAVKIGGRNVIIRYLTFRPGDRSGQEVDGLGGMDQMNLIVDHCSVSWSVDECLSVYGSRNLTVQWCIASEALRVSVHGKGTHCYGGNWGGNRASYHHNLIAHCESRTPRLGPRPSTQTNEYVDIRNNVFYNWAGNGCYGGEGMKVNIVNNYYKPGPATDTRSANIQKRIAGIGIRTSSYTDHDTDNPNEWDKMWHVWGKFYVDGNYNPDHEDVTNDNWTYGIYNQVEVGKVDGTYTEVTKDTMRLDLPLETDYITTHTAEVAYEKVLAYVGNSLYRDAIDERIISDTRNREATIQVKNNAPGFINSPDVDLKPENAAADWSPFPELPYDDSRGDITDSDGDGMPNAWENANGLNPNDAEDGKAVTLSEEGYTNLEVYLNSLVAHITEAQNADGVTNWFDETTSGIDETSAPAVANVYAADGMIYVDGLASDARVEVYALAGALVYVGETSSDQLALPMGNGLYVVRVVSGGQAQSFKVVVD